MKTLQGKVLKLYISTGDKDNPREEVSSLEVTPDGIIHDKFYAKDPNRAILFTAAHSYEMVSKNGIEIPLGSLGENIYIDISPYNLLPEDTLQVGEVTFEITQNCTLCKGLSTLDPKLPKLLKDDRGIFAKALQRAVVKVGDTVTIHQHE